MTNLQGLLLNISKKNREGIMFERISAYIVNKRKAFMVFFILAAVFSVFSSSWVKVSNKLSDYLPESTKTKDLILWMRILPPSVLPR